MDKTQKSYKSISSGYDDVMLQNKWWSQIYREMFWGKVDDRELAKKTLAYIPEDFSGYLLDVPAGTSVFTHELYKKIKYAKICCLDYSEEMLEKTRERLGTTGNVRIMQGDVSKMPFANNTFNIVLSMNGLHAFPSKDQAFAETYRVLKTGGKFIASTYIKGKLKSSDFIVNKFLAPKGWFTPPFETEESLKERLEKMYRIEDFNVEGSQVYFCAVKK